jgi:hypothetical protein
MKGHIGKTNEGIHGDKPREWPERCDATQSFICLVLK